MKFSHVSAHIPGEVVAPQDSVSDNILTYVSFRQNACTSYKLVETCDIGADIVRYSTQVRARNVGQVWASAFAGNPGDCLELGLRMWTGCGMAKDEDSALDWWRKIADPTHSEHVSSASRPLRTKALSCMANAYLERSNVDEKTLQIDDLYRAGKLADACASYGLVTPIVLVIAARIETVGLRRQADCRFSGTDTTRFEMLEFLWAAFEARNAEIRAEDQKRDAKTSKAPNLYQCAAEHCGIEATKKSGLSKCAGPCLPDVKPSYCSKDCQRTDWNRHRAVCKGNDAKTKQQTPSTTSSTKVSDNTIHPGNLRNDGKELVTEWPAPGGKTVKVSSTTMTPAFMKEVREILEKEVESK